MSLWDVWIVRISPSATQSATVSGKFLCRRSDLRVPFKCSCVFANNCYCSVWLHNASLLSGTASLRQDRESPIQQQQTAAVLYRFEQPGEVTVIGPKWKDAFVLVVNEGRDNENTKLLENWHLPTTASILPQDKQNCTKPKKKNVTFPILSTSPAVFPASYSFTQGWFHYQRSAGAKAPFQVKKSNLSSVRRRRPVNY